MASHKVTVSKVTHPRYNYRVRYPNGGERLQKFFKKKTGQGGADEFAQQKQDEITQRGIEDASISKEERRAVLKFRDAGCGATLSDAVEHYLQHLQLNYKAMTCEEVTDKLLHRLDKEHKSHRHIQSVKHRLERFNEEYGDRFARDISVDIIDDFLNNLNLAPKTVTNYRLSLSLMFTHAIRLKASGSNPVADAVSPKVTPKEACFFTPEQVASFLSACDDNVVAGYAIAFFTGIRSSEILDLDWSEVYLEQGEIGVRLDIAKGAKRRLVKISDNLRAWIMPHAKRKGKVVKNEYVWNKGRRDARERIGMGKWLDNVARHSFASYHLAHHEDAGSTAMSLGHPNPALLYSTYRALVSSRAADTYWNIKPQQLDNVTDIKAS
jgi:integrase